MKEYLVLAINKLCPTAEFVFENDDYSTIKWHLLEGNAPTKAEIDAAIDQIKGDEQLAETKAAADKAVLLTKLGITADEAKLLLS